MCLYVPANLANAFENLGCVNLLWSAVYMGCVFGELNVFVRACCVSVYLSVCLILPVEN